MGLEASPSSQSPPLRGLEVKAPARPRGPGFSPKGRLRPPHQAPRPGLRGGMGPLPHATLRRESAPLFAQAPQRGPRLRENAPSRLPGPRGQTPTHPPRGRRPRPPRTPRGG